MYAISHAATALPIQRRYPQAGIWPILISVQLVELLWVVFTYTGIEHYVVSGGRVHLGFLPYSHSVATGVVLGAAAWRLLRGRSRQLAAAVAIGIVSHVVLDIIQHEPDITLLPIDLGPHLGFGLHNLPAVNLIVELVYGAACWWVFGGSIALLAGIVLFNLADWPLMTPRPDSVAQLAAHPVVLPTVILAQIIASWLLVAWLSRARAPRS